MTEFKWEKKHCVICGREFEYVSNGIYEPDTCLDDECNKKKLHPELKKSKPPR